MYKRLHDWVNFFFFHHFSIGLNITDNYGDALLLNNARKLHSHYFPCCPLIPSSFKSIWQWRTAFSKPWAPFDRFVSTAAGKPNTLPCEKGTPHWSELENNCIRWYGSNFPPMPANLVWYFFGKSGVLEVTKRRKALCQAPTRDSLFSVLHFAFGDVSPRFLHPSPLPRITVISGRRRQPVVRLPDPLINAHTVS